MRSCNNVWYGGGSSPDGDRSRGITGPPSARCCPSPSGVHGSEDQIWSDRRLAIMSALPETGRDGGDPVALTVTRETPSEVKKGNQDEHSIYLFREQWHLRMIPEPPDAPHFSRQLGGAVYGSSSEAQQTRYSLAQRDLLPRKRHRWLFRQYLDAR